MASIRLALKDKRENALAFSLFSYKLTLVRIVFLVIKRILLLVLGRIIFLIVSTVFAVILKIVFTTKSIINLVFRHFSHLFSILFFVFLKKICKKISRPQKVSGL